MTPIEALDKAREIVRQGTGKEPEEHNTENFLEFADLVTQVLQYGWTKQQRDECPWLPEFALTFKKTKDDFSNMVSRDPMMLYTPRNDVALEFHKSPAFLRYFRAGNRTSKTQSGVAEHYWLTTGQHPYRKFPQEVNSSFIVAGLPFTKYAPMVFEAKFISGGGAEGDNPLAPMFPEGGKWLYHYDARKYIITIACPKCAEKGMAQRCTHKKRKIALFSSESSVDIMEGFAASMAHFDEHVGEEFYTAARQRIASVKGSCMIVTGTPLHGPESWETRLLADRADGNPAENKVVKGDANSAPYVTMHQVSQYDGNVVDKTFIDMQIADMDDFEISARIMGIPAPLAKNPVFDRHILMALSKRARGPEYVKLDIKPGETLEHAVYPTDIEAFESHPPMKNDRSFTGLRVWERPLPRTQYIIGIDTAAGLTGRDASCATVFRVFPDAGGRHKFRQVAQFHGWAGIHDYAEECKKLGLWYNSALLIVELTGGLGRAVVEHLKRHLFYSNIFRDTSQPEQFEPGLSSRLGVDTNAGTKPAMVAVSQQLLKERRLDIPCADTIRELTAFEQERTESGLNVRYRGAAGSHDDRTMSLIIAISVGATSPMIYFDPEEIVIESRGKQYSEEWQELHDEIKRTSAEHGNPFA